jgi:hypothetical protein
VRQDARRSALPLHDASNRLVAALLVSDAWCGRTIGRSLLAQAEESSVAAGCHSGLLDTVQARGFNLVFGHQQFGALDGYPLGQTRNFLCKRLVAAIEAPSPRSPADSSIRLVQYADLPGAASFFPMESDAWNPAVEASDPSRTFGRAHDRLPKGLISVE